MFDWKCSYICKSQMLKVDDCQLFCFLNALTRIVAFTLKLSYVTYMCNGHLKVTLTCQIFISTKNISLNWTHFINDKRVRRAIYAPWSLSCSIIAVRNIYAPFLFALKFVDITWRNFRNANIDYGNKVITLFSRTASNTSRTIFK